MYSFQAHAHRHTRALITMKCYYIKRAEGYLLWYLNGRSTRSYTHTHTLLSLTLFLSYVHAQIHLHQKAFKKAFLCSFFTWTLITTPFSAPTPPLSLILVSKTLASSLISHTRTHSPQYTSDKIWKEEFVGSETRRRKKSWMQVVAGWRWRNNKKIEWKKFFYKVPFCKKIEVSLRNIWRLIF